MDEIPGGEEHLIRALSTDSNIKNLGGGQVWWSIPLIPACRGPREEDLGELEANLVYITTAKCMTSTRQRQADLFQS